MDENTIISGIVGAVTIPTVLALWRFVVMSNRHCREDNKDLRKEIKEIREAVEKRSIEELRKAEEREDRAWARVTAMNEVLGKTQEVTQKAVDIIRRSDPHIYTTPQPGKPR